MPLPIVFTTKFKKWLDESMPLGTGAHAPYRRMTDVLAAIIAAPFPASSPVGGGGFVTPAAAGGLAVDVSGGFIRNAALAIVEVKPAVTLATADTTSAGQSIVYRIVADGTTGAVTAVAGTAATSGSQVAPATATGKVSLATVTIVHGNTVPAATNINNLARTFAG